MTVKLIASISTAAARVRVRHYNPALTIRMHPLDIDEICRNHSPQKGVPCWPGVEAILGYPVEADEAVARGRYIIEWEEHPDA
jgi:hypothetical protein